MMNQEYQIVCKWGKQLDLASCTIILLFFFHVVYFVGKFDAYCYALCDVVDAAYRNSEKLNNESENPVQSEGISKTLRFV